MKFMIIVPANNESEAGALPTTEELEAMGKFNEELVKAGVMLAGEGLHPSSKGARITFGKGGKSSVKDGPFTESKELVAGFWILQVKSKEECIAWMSRAPFGEGATLEIRQVHEAEDFAPVDPDGKIRDHEEQLRREIEKQQQR
ncbi:MAG: YciI family protein [Labilithrix sp.]|nr:YciI family protein [Labilithrix sp.]MCW5811054.1 YciI family protein [Labilithrix sp.]